MVERSLSTLRYLTRLNIPADEAAGLPDLMEAYERLLQDFKLAHKRTRLTAQADGSEIQRDIKEMAIERDIVIKRLETVQQQFLDTRQREELLNLGKALREHQERATELSEQFSEQDQHLQNINQRLQRDLNSFRGQLAIPNTVDEFIANVGEEIQLNHYLVKEKFPKELSEVQRELGVLQRLHDDPPSGREDLIALQQKIEKVNREIESLVQKKMSALDPQDDKLTPFRQQASVIKSNKDDVANKLQHLKNELREAEAALADKQSKVKQLLGDTVLRGDELKKYVNKLRNKSSVYKRQRAAISSLKMETEVLSRTLDILRAADPSLEMALVNNNKLEMDPGDEDNSKKPSLDLSKRTLNELSQMAAVAAREAAAARAALQPLSSLAAPVARDHQHTLQLYNQKKRVYDSTMINLTSQVEPLEREIRELKEIVDKKEGQWKVLRQKIDKAEQLKEVVENESKDFRNVTSPRHPSRVEQLQRQIADLENTLLDLREEQKAISSCQWQASQQTALWSNALQLLQCKQQCRRAVPAPDTARLTITHRTQTLTLQSD